MKVLLIPALLALLGACTANTNNSHQRSILAFGTVIDVTIVHPDQTLVTQAFQQLQTDFQTMHRLWHPWNPGPLQRTNQLLQTGAWFSAAPSLYPLLIRARELAIQSEHFFNPAIGKLVKLWGFHRDNPSGGIDIDPQELKRLQANIPTMQDIELDGIRMRGLNPDIQLDVGGIAKGYGIDRAIDSLQRMGIDNAIINAGGDLRAIGKHGQRPWKVGIQHPRANTVLASLETLTDESVFTSGDYQRFYTQAGQRYQHIIDPFTGVPVTKTVAVTVIHANATLADAAATALMVAGPENWQRIAQQLGIRYVMLLASDGTLHLSPSMQKRLTLNDALPYNLSISTPPEKP